MTMDCPSTQKEAITSRLIQILAESNLDLSITHHRDKSWQVILVGRIGKTKFYNSYSNLKLINAVVSAFTDVINAFHQDDDEQK